MVRKVRECEKGKGRKGWRRGRKRGKKRRERTGGREERRGTHLMHGVLKHKVAVIVGSCFLHIL